MNKETIDLKLLHYFMEVAEVLNFTLASSKLGVPKSVLSKAIVKLEEQIGEKVFERSSRVVTLTSTGKILQQRAPGLLEESSHLLNDLRAMRHTVAGQITIAAPPVLGRYLAGQIIPSFIQQWPQVHVSMLLSYSYENLFKEGIDLAFRMGKNRDENLIQRPIGVTNRVLVASPEYLKQYHPVDSIDDLSCLQSAQFYQGQYQGLWTLQNKGQSVQVELPRVFQCEDLDAVTHAVIAGVGVAQLPWLLVKEAIEQGKLVHILPDWLSPDLAISLVYRQGHNKSARLAEFLTWIEQHKDLFDLRASTF